MASSTACIVHSQSFSQFDHQFGKSAAAVRARALLVNRHLGAGETDLGVEEVRVITEAAIAARCVDHLAVPAPLGDDRLQVVLARMTSARTAV